MVLAYRNRIPNIDTSCFIASTATVIGDVTLHHDASVWFGTVIRGDNDHIEIGAGTNIQDNCTLHTDVDHQIHIGERVTIGHNVIIHGAFIDDEVLIGMGAVLLNGAKIGKRCLIGANTLIRENQVIPDDSVAVGNPARIIKRIQEDQFAHILENAEHYQQLKDEYKIIEGDNYGSTCK